MESVAHSHTDLFEKNWKHIGHGTNCRGLMGAGIAAVFARKFPQMKRDYQRYCSENNNIVGTCFVWSNPNSPQKIYNIFSQDVPGAHAQLEWLESGLSEAMESVGSGELHIPWIGAGIGGLLIKDVAATIKNVAAESRGKIVVHTHPNTQIDSNAIAILTS